MQLLKMGQDDNCMAFSMAMLLGITPETVYKKVGHNGKELIDVHSPPPLCYRLFNINELVLLCMRYKYALVPLDFFPMSSHSATGVQFSLGDFSNEISGYLQRFDAMLVTDSHACAWDHHQKVVFDPNGYIKQLEEYKWLQCCLLIPFVGIKNIGG